MCIIIYVHVIHLIYRHPNDDSAPPLTNYIMTYDTEPFRPRNKTLPDSSSDDVTPYACADIGYNRASNSTFQPSHLPNEPVNPSNDRSALQNVSNVALYMYVRSLITYLFITKQKCTSNIA